MKHHLPVALWLARSSLAQKEAAIANPAMLLRTMGSIVSYLVTACFLLCSALLGLALWIAPTWAWVSIPVGFMVLTSGLAWLGHLRATQAHQEACKHLFAGDDDTSQLPTWPWWSRTRGWQLDLAEVLLEPGKLEILRAQKLDQSTPQAGLEKPLRRL